ncbi:MAG: tetratricopeptide repeat protein [Deferribacteraceae bacterium]|jgi:lipopolysaccharide biosynthesis regulator YciM|nr:tetratricopeptide repeat protein [Deferribacteraceae bacterium]
MITAYPKITILVLLAIIAIVFWLLKGKKMVAAKREPIAPIKGFYLLASGEYDKALEELRAAALSGSGTPEVYLSMAVIYRKKNELNKAIHINEGLLLRKDLPANIIITILHELIIDYRAANDVGKAEECLARISDIVSDNSTLLLQAEIASEKGEHTAAIKYYSKYERAADNDPCNKEISYEYMRMAELETEPSRKHKALKEAIKAYPANRLAQFAKAKLYFDEGKIREGRELIESIIKSGIIKTADDVRMIEDSYYKYSTLEELVSVMSEQVAADSESPAPYLFLSKIYKKRGEERKAVEMLQDYLLLHRPKAVITRAYAHIANDQVVLRVARLDNNYSCTACDTKYMEYQETCSHCGELDTLDYA